MANVEGKATAITVVTPVRHGGRFLLALVFWVGRHVTSTLEKLHALSFIHYARWAVIRRFPDGGRGERLGHTYLFFESNFNGTWDQYNEYVANHYWSAYPKATTTEIVSARRVAAALDDFQRRSAGLDPDAFAAAYRALLTDVQRDL